MTVKTDNRLVLRRWATIAAAAAACLAPSLAMAQAWPTKQPIKAIIPFPPGSTTDIIGRMVMDQVSKQLGQTIIPENRPGASTTTATGIVAKADPDGYTLLIASSSFTVVPSTFSTLPYNPNELAPVAMLANMANVTIVPGSRPYRTIKDLVDAAKANPGKMNYASIGAGSATHLTAERLRLSAGFEATHVPFKGTAEAMTEILADRIDFYCSPIAAVVPLAKEGKIKALAVSTLKRSAALPDVPTSVEAGYKNSEYDFWIGTLVPAATPQDIVTRLYTEINRALDNPELASRFLTLGADQFRMTSAEFGQLIAREIKSNAELVRMSGLKGAK